LWLRLRSHERKDMPLERARTSTPDQFSVGGQYEVGPFSDRYWLQPNVDVAFGNDATLVAGNFDAVYRRSLTRSTAWTGYAGGGPALNWYKLNGYSATELGVNALGGLMHGSGMFVEARVGFLESPRFRFGVGYAFGRTKATGTQRTPPRRRK
jgi:hypothetical protein